MFFLFVYYFPVKQLAMFLTSFYLQACIIALSHVPSRIAPTIYVIYCVYMAFQNDRVESKGITCTRMLSYMQVKKQGSVSNQFSTLLLLQTLPLL